MKIAVILWALFLSSSLAAQDDKNQINECLREAELEMIHAQVEQLGSNCANCDKNNQSETEDKNKPLSTYSCI